MKTVVEMTREAGGFDATPKFLERFAELVRADERNSWPAEMEAMERQVNILTDALAQEREACAKVCESKNTLLEWPTYAAAIRARSNT